MVLGRRFDAAVVLGFLALCGLGSLALGQDISQDLRHYHFYSGYALLTGRLGQDIAPGARGTFFNPVMDAFHYLGMTRLPARVFGFLLGAIHGLNPILIYFIARRTFGGPQGGSRLLALVAALFAAVGPVAVIVLGTASGDSLASIPVLASLLALIVALDRAAGRPRLSLLLLGGVLAGVGVGLKLTMAPFAIALGVAFLASAADFRGVGALVASELAGYLAVAGYWCWKLWTYVGNPLFPFANTIFRSPFFDSVWLRDRTYRVQSLTDLLRPPLDMLLGHTERLQEAGFRDARFFVVAVLAVLYLGRLVSRRDDARAPLAASERLVLTYMLAGYGIWIVAFTYYRYMLPLELLAPVVLFVLLRAVLTPFPRIRPQALYPAIAAAVVLYSRFQPTAWGRSEGWRDGEWFSVRVPRLGMAPNAVVLFNIPGNSFVIPFFPVETRFLNMAHACSARFDEEIERVITRHSGPILYTLPTGDRLLAHFGLRDAGHCEPLKTDHGRFGICLAERVGR